MLKMHRKTDAGSKRTGVISEMDYKGLHGKALYWILFALLCIAVAVSLIPPLYVFVSSVKDTKEFYQIPPTIIPRTVDLSKIVEVWKRYDFKRYYLNTAFVAVFSVTWSLFSNGLAGYVLSKIKPRGHKIVFALVMASLMIPTTISIVPLYKNFVSFPIGGFSMINTYFPMILMTGCNAFMVIVYKSFFDGIPTDLLDAAEIDGCGTVAKFCHIVAPLSKSVLATGAILAFNATWNDFFWPYLVLKESSKATVMIEIFAVRGSVSQDKLLVLLAFAILPPALIFIFFQKNIMQGLTMSGIKG